MISTWISAAVVAALASAFAGADAGEAASRLAPGAAAVVAGTVGGEAVDPAPAADITISGPGTVKPNASCTWWAIGSDAVGFGYTYEWSGGTMTDQYDNAYSAMKASGTLSLSVTVYDRFGGVVGTAYKNVSVTSSSAPCMI